MYLEQTTSILCLARQKPSNADKTFALFGVRNPEVPQLKIHILLMFPAQAIETSNLFGHVP
jgi:hypothetical protein